MDYNEANGISVMKYKLKDFKGIVTNYDSKDLSLEALRDSVNFKFNNGFATVDFPKLSPISSGEDYTQYPVTYLPVLGEGWGWERGIFARLQGDILKEGEIDPSIDVVVLVSKKTENGTTYRNIWMRKWTTSDDDKWMLMHKGGENAPTLFIDESIYTTTIEGDTFIKAIDGVIKIYMPHDSFWLGRINRTFYSAGYDELVINQIYIDRLVEPFDKDNLGVSYETVYLGRWFGIDITIPDQNKPIVKPGRRLGVSAYVEIRDTQAETTKDAAINFKFQKEDWVALKEVDGESIYLKTFLYKATDKTTGEFIPSPYKPSSVLSADLFAEKYHFFFRENSPITGLSEGNVYVSVDYSISMIFTDGDTFADKYGASTHSPNVLAKTNVDSEDSDWHIATLDGDWYVINRTVFEQDVATIGLIYIGQSSIGTVGFPNTSTHFDMIATAVLDENEEVIIWTHSEEVDVTNEKYAIKLSIVYPARDGNRRLTRIRFYLKFTGDTDFTKVKELNYIDPDIEDAQTFYITTEDFVGELLAQNIGFLFDEGNPQTYKIINNIRDIATHSSVSIALRQNDFNNVYYSIVGGGTLQDDLFYTATVLPVKTIGYLQAVAVLGNGLALVGEDRVTLVNIDEIAGNLTFSLNDTLEFGVKDRYDAIEMQGGLLLHTKEGIFITDGYNKQWISEAINNIVRDNYSTGRVFYNSNKQQIYYFPTMNMTYYLFSMERKKWEKYSIKDEEAVDFFLDLNGNETFLTNAQIAGTRLYAYYNTLLADISYLYNVTDPLPNPNDPPFIETFVGNTYNDSIWINHPAAIGIQGFDSNAWYALSKNVSYEDVSSNTSFIVSAANINAAEHSILIEADAKLDYPGGGSGLSAGVLGFWPQSLGSDVTDFFGIELSDHNNGYGHLYIIKDSVVIYSPHFQSLGLSAAGGYTYPVVNGQNYKSFKVTYRKETNEIKFYYKSSGSWVQMGPTQVVDFSDVIFKGGFSSIQAGAVGPFGLIWLDKITLNYGKSGVMGI